MTWPKSSTTISSQTLEHEAHVVVDEQDGHAGLGQRAQVVAELDALVGVEAGGGLVHQHEPRPLGERAGDADQLAAAVRELGRHAVGDVGRGRRGRAPSRRRRAGGSPIGSSRSRSACSTPMRWLATSRFSSTVRSSNSSTLWKVRTRPRRARRCGRRRVMSSPSNVTVPRGGRVVAGERVDRSRSCRRRWARSGRRPCPRARRDRRHRRR